MAATGYPPLGQLARKHASLANIPDSPAFPNPTEPPLCIDLEDLEEYKVDIYLSMLTSESQTLYPYRSDIYYFRYRRILVDWMSEVGDEFHLNPLTTHSAVHYLDRILSRVQVGRSRLQLVAMACILISAKFEEQEDFIPNLFELNETSNNAYTTQLIASMEQTILAELQWHLKACTPLHFLGYYSLESVTINDEWRGRTCNNRVKFYVDRYAEFFLELCQQEHTFLEIKPSIVAAASLYTARSMLGVTPTWSPGLERVSGYSDTDHDLQACVELIKVWYDALFPQLGKDDVSSPMGVLDTEDHSGYALDMSIDTSTPGVATVAPVIPQVAWT